MMSRILRTIFLQRAGRATAEECPKSRHSCDRCRRKMHGFCEVGIGADGDGQKRRCRVCATKSRVVVDLEAASVLLPENSKDAQPKDSVAPIECTTQTNSMTAVTALTGHLRTLKSAFSFNIFLAVRAVTCGAAYPTGGLWMAVASHVTSEGSKKMVLQYSIDPRLAGSLKTKLNHSTSKAGVFGCASFVVFATVTAAVQRPGKSGNCRSQNRILPKTCARRSKSFEWCCLHLPPRRQHQCCPQLRRASC